MSCEVSRMRGPPAPREVISRADQQAPHLTETPRHHARIRERRDAQRQIEAAADQLDRLIAQMQVDRDLRIGVEEIGKRRRHVLDAEGHRRRHSYPAARRRRLRQCLRLDRLRIGQDLGRAHRQDAPGFGQRQSARGAVEQTFAEAALQSRNCLGDGRLREVELGSGAGKGAGFGDFGEDGPGFEVGELRHRFWKRCVSNGSIFKSATRPILSSSTSEIAHLEVIT
jgi:hypothetical protein